MLNVRGGEGRERTEEEEAKAPNEKRIEEESHEK